MSPKFAIFTLLVVTVAGLAALGQSPSGPTTPGPLDGTWELVSMIEDGKPIPITLVKQTVLRDGRITIAGGFVALTRADGSTAFLPFSTDPTTKPKRLDLSGTRSIGGKGIYLRDGDTLLICIAGTDEQARPTEFGSLAGSGSVLMTFQKASDRTAPVARPTTPPAPDKPPTGDNLRRALIGTWGHQTDELVEKITLNPDNTFSLWLSYKRGFKKLFEQQDRVSGRWDVVDSVVTMTVTASTLPDRQGQVYSFQVLRINNSEVLYRDNQTGQRRIEWKVQ